MPSLREFLKQPNFGSLTLLTDHPDEVLDEEVDSIEISETPDVEYHIPPRVILLTTAMVFEDSQADMPAYLDSLKRAEVVALGIKTGRFLHHLDPEVKAYAEKIALPIFDIPDHLQLGQVLHQMMDFRWHKQKNELFYALEIQRNFSNLLFSNAGIERIINQLGRVTNTPVMLLDPFHDVITASADMQQTGFDASKLSRKIIHQQERLGKNFGTFTLRLTDDRKLPLQITKITTGHAFPYFLVLLYPETIPFPTSQFALDQAAIVISFYLYKTEEIATSRLHTQNERLQELLHLSEQGLTLDDSWFEQSTHNPFVHSSHYQMINTTVTVKTSEAALHIDQAELTLTLARWLNKRIQDYLPKGTVFFTGSEQIFLLSQQGDEHLDKKLRQLASDVETRLPLSVCFNLGRPVSKLKHIHRSYTEAKLAYQDRQANRQKDLILRYTDKGLQTLFSQTRPSDIAYYCESTLKSLAYPEDDYYRDLRQTLKVYLDHQCEITTTAKKLYIHRNTVKYRIQRCEDLLGFDLETPEHTLALRLTLELSEHEQKH